MIEKRKPLHIPKIRKAARGEACCAEFPGCTGGGEDTALRHLNEGWAGKGGAQKADDIAAFFGCQHCENLYSGLLMNSPYWEQFKEDKYFYLIRAVYNTMRRLFDKGVIK